MPYKTVTVITTMPRIPIKLATIQTFIATSGTGVCCKTKTSIDAKTTPHQITPVLAAIDTLPNFLDSTLFIEKAMLAVKANQSAKP